jgi:uncharacterized protein YeaC (DUF1315 family)
MGESFDRNIKQASLQTVTTHQARRDEEEEEEEVEKAYKQIRVSKHRRVLTLS